MSSSANKKALDLLISSLEKGATTNNEWELLRSTLHSKDHWNETVRLQIRFRLGLANYSSIFIGRQSFITFEKLTVLGCVSSTHFGGPHYKLLPRTVKGVLFKMGGISCRTNAGKFII